MSCEINQQLQATNFKIPCQTSTEINFDLVKTNQSFGWNFEGKSRGLIPTKLEIEPSYGMRLSNSWLLSTTMLVQTMFTMQQSSHTCLLL